MRPRPHWLPRFDPWEIGDEQECRGEESRKRAEAFMAMRYALGMIAESDSDCAASDMRRIAEDALSFWRESQYA